MPFDPDNCFPFPSPLAESLGTVTSLFPFQSINSQAPEKFPFRHCSWPWDWDGHCPLCPLQTHVTSPLKQAAPWASRDPQQNWGGLWSLVKLTFQKHVLCAGSWPSPNRQENLTREELFALSFLLIN
jgi:hypothetical protein